MKVVYETETALCMEHDNQLFLVPKPTNFSIIAHYIDRKGNLQTVFHRSLYGEHVHNALKEHNKSLPCTCSINPDYCEVHAA
jgi:hypothetical protein